MPHVVQDVEGALPPVISGCSPSKHTGGKKLPCCTTASAVAVAENALRIALSTRLPWVRSPSAPTRHPLSPHAPLLCGSHLLDCADHTRVKGRRQCAGA